MDINETQETQIKTEKQRGPMLSAFLILMFIVNPLTAFTYINSPDVIIETYPKMTIGILYILSALSMINVILAIGIWNWKKWGVYGFYAVVVIVFAINLYVGLGIASSLSGIIGGIIVHFITKNKWEHFS